MKPKSSPRDDCEDIDHCREGENKHSQNLLGRICSQRDCKVELCLYPSPKS